MAHFHKCLKSKIESLIPPYVSKGWIMTKAHFDSVCTHFQALTSNVVTISLRTGGQGRPTPIHIPTPPTKHKHLQRSFYHFSTLAHGRTDGRTNGQKASNRVACPQLKKDCYSFINCRKSVTIWKIFKQSSRLRPRRKS